MLAVLAIESQGCGQHRSHKDFFAVFNSASTDRRGSNMDVVVVRYLVFR